MFEVIPNWHPLFVHFSIALLSMSTLFFVALKFINKTSFQEQLKTMAYWNLWLGTAFAIVTAIAGWFAYNSVAHDTPSHEAMTDHRNWALMTLSVFIVISAWSIKQYKSVKKTGMAFTLAIVIAFGLLASTGWRGSEVVYRFGLGVMSLPQAEGEGHAHEHAEGEGHSSLDAVEKSKAVVNKGLSSEDTHDKIMNEHNHSDHKH